MSQFQTRIYPEQDIIAAGVDLKRVLRGAEYEAVTIIRNASHGGCTTYLTPSPSFVEVKRRFPESFARSGRN
jgi:hypothetical protein